MRRKSTSVSSRQHSRNACAFIALLMCTTVATPAFAASEPGANPDDDRGVDEIIVTARRKEESVQSVPVAVTAITAGTLERANVQNLTDVSRIAPSTSIRAQAQHAGAITAHIRGLGSSEIIASVDPGIGIYVDGVYLGSNNAANLEMMDISQVEVLRGPQGTLFGRNSTGGALNITTRKSPEDFGVQLRGSYADFNERSGKLRVDTGTLGGTGLQATFVAMARKRDGYFDQVDRPSSKDPGALDTKSFGAKVHGEWGDLSLDYSFDHTKIETSSPVAQLVAIAPLQLAYYSKSASLGGAVFPPVVSEHLRSGNAAPYIPANAKSGGHSLTLTYNASDSLTLKSITGYRTYRGENDGYYGPDGLLGATTTGVQTVYLFRGTEKTRERAFTQELQALGDVGDFSYVLGAFYFDQKFSQDQFYSFTFPLSADLAVVLPSGNPNRGTGKSIAGYGQLSFKPSAVPGLELTAGARYTRDKKTFDLFTPDLVYPADLTQTQLFEGKARVKHTNADPLFVGNKSFKNFSYLLSLSYQFTPDTMGYAKWSTAYRAGGFNGRTTSAAAFVFKPEKVRTAEIGFKTDLFDRRLRLNAAAFHTKFDQIQVNNFVGVGGDVFNPNATIKGVEAEATINVSEAFQVFGAFGYIDPQYKRPVYLLPPVPPATTPVDYADTSVFPRAPNFTGNVGAQFTKELSPSVGTLIMRVDHSFSSERSFSINKVLNPFFDEVNAPAWSTTSARISLSEIPLGGQMTGDISVWANNIFNKDIVDWGIDFGALGFGVDIFNMPRQVGVTATFNY